MNIFVTNFPSGISNRDLEALFRPFGDVEDAIIWVQRKDRSYRFAIVDMPEDREGARAIRKLHRKRFSEERLWVQQAPYALVDMLNMCVEAPQILGSQDASSSRSDEPLWDDPS
jgi:RNA recognition motif-containing protein